MQERKDKFENQMGSEGVYFLRGCLRQSDYDDWRTTTEFFDFFNALWGPFTIDRFADNENSQLPRFNSKFYCPGTEGVDAFSLS